MVIHYIYKIHFLCGYPSGRYYIGKHTHNGADLSTDRYTGSGVFCFHYFKKYGRKPGITYIKEILEINPSKKINDDRELFYIGNLSDDDPLCMNISIGKSGATHTVFQYSKKGEFIAKYDSECDAYKSIGINGDGSI